jgi:hypothetical protein
MAEQKTMTEAQFDQMKMDYENRFRTLEYALKVQDADRKSAETENRIDVSGVEMALAIEATENASEENLKSSAMISPNG